eukprot:3573019-Rhodomonas_salina.1
MPAYMKWHHDARMQCGHHSSDTSSLSVVVQGVMTENIRPTMDKNTEARMAALIEKCWDVDPENRPDFKQCTTSTRRVLLVLVLLVLVLLVLGAFGTTVTPRPVTHFCNDESGPPPELVEA